MKNWFIAGIVCAMVCAVALPNLYAVDVPADGAKLDYMHGKNDLVTIFNHSTHKAAGCEECHHMKGDKQYAKCGDAGCHDNFDKKDKSVHSWYKVTHARKGTKLSTCVSCHAAAVDEKGGDKAYKKEMTGCKGSGCHPK